MDVTSVQERRQPVGSGAGQVQPGERLPVSWRDRRAGGLHHDPGSSTATLLQRSHQALQNRYPPITRAVACHNTALSSLHGSVARQLFLFCSREKVSPAKDHWKKAPHQRDDSQAAAVQHLENGERVLRVCPGTVSVRARPRRQRKGRRALRPRAELLLWKDLSQG